MVEGPTGRAAACGEISLVLREPLLGTAASAAGHLLLEHAGPWGRRFLDDDTLPDGLGEVLDHACTAADLTPLLARRADAAEGAALRPTIVVAVPDGRGLVVSRRLGSIDDVRALDVPAVAAAARAGVPADGWDVVPYLLAVCTDGGRDACCGSLGTPVAKRLAQRAPLSTWEVTHIGGHRMAATVLALPSGVAYGRVPPEWAPHLQSAVAGGRLLMGLVRGRSSLPAAVQVAEVALRGHLDEDRDGALLLEGHVTVPLPDPPGVRTTSTWSVAASSWRVVVDSTPGGVPRTTTCGALPVPAPQEHTVVEVTDADHAGRGAQGWDAAHRTEIGAPHALVVEVATGTPPGTALDIACGTGRHSLWLAENGWQVTGLDFSRAGLGVAAGEAAARDLQVDWQLGDARVWTPPQDGYDLVLMAFVHLPSVLARAVRWLRPGGRIVIVGHSLRNATHGVGGPSDPRRLHDVVDLAARVTGARLRVLRATEVERRVGAEVAIDVLLVATRLPAR